MPIADRCGVEIVRDSNEIAQLPPADRHVDTSGVITVPPALSNTLLAEELSRFWTSRRTLSEVVTPIVRRLAMTVHPDSADPNVEKYKWIKKAKEAMLND
ncbi:hypothetical protein [Haloterrigena salifodinae]|uniref:hypothetical protein n=1 Tax=Haloterrigena salifodinae TaxID=2675099 RepID=UPI000F886821|nr:hypothetical protein [Haloterrigena salifodinae]